MHVQITAISCSAVRVRMHAGLMHVPDAVHCSIRLQGSGKQPPAGAVLGLILQSKLVCQHEPQTSLMRVKTGSHTSDWALPSCCGWLPGWPESAGHQALSHMRGIARVKISSWTAWRARVQGHHDICLHTRM